MSEDNIKKTIEELAQGVRQVLDGRKQAAIVPPATPLDAILQRVRPRIGKQFVVMFFHLPHGHPQTPGLHVRFVGPFGSYERAEGWAEQQLKPQHLAYTIADLSAPGEVR